MTRYVFLSDVLPGVVAVLTLISSVIMVQTLMQTPKDDSDQLNPESRRNPQAQQVYIGVWIEISRPRTLML
jgi:hypothetical protein